MQEGTEVNGYRIGRLIGSGLYGSVNEVTKEGKTYAMKRLNQLPQANQLTEVVVARDEMYRLVGVRHPFIIRYFEEFRLDTGPETYFVMELCTGVNMRTAINTTREQSGNFPSEIIRRWLVQLLMAVAYLHQKGIVHREIKPNNIFILDNFSRLKLGDLSLVKTLSQSASQTHSSARRTRESYRAPELWLGLILTCKVDEWSVGCVLYELMRLQPPFNITNLMNIIEGIYDPIPPGQYDDTGLIQILEIMLVRNPDERFHAIEILEKFSELHQVRDEMQQLCEDVEPLPGGPEDKVDDLSAMESDIHDQYSLQSSPICTRDELVRFTWRDMVDGRGGELAFRPCSLPAEYGDNKVLLWLVRREPNWGTSLDVKQDMRIWVQSQNQPENVLRLKFCIKFTFTRLNGESRETFEYDVNTSTAVTENIKILYNEQKFNWSELDPETLPSARVTITSDQS